MVEKTTLHLILFMGLVLALSFKDMLLIKQPNPTEQNQKENNLNKDGSINLNINEDHSNENEKEQEDDVDQHSNLDNRDNKSDAHLDSSSDQFDNDDDEPIDSSSPASFETSKTIPSLKMKSNVQTLKFLFCYSCGYRNMFEQYSQLIHSKYPELKIIGENYTPSQYKIYLAQFLSTFKLVIIGFVILGQNPFGYLNMPTPNIYNWAVQNKLYASLMTFFISNVIETHLITSGAFEIYLNDMQIWSKLQSDRMPHEKELLQILDMNFNFEPDKASGFGNNRESFKN